MTKRLPPRLAPVLMAAVLGAAACSSGGDPSDGGDASAGGADAGNGSQGATDLDSSQILLTSALQTVDSCDALLSRIKDDAIERVGPYGFDQGGGPIPLEGDVLPAGNGDDLEESAPETTGALTPSARAAGDETTADGAVAIEADAGGGGGGQDFSGTNNQEQGVDEADLVKTDGERLVVASGNVLRVIDTTGPTPELTRSIELPEEIWGGELFLAGDRALLMTTGYTERPFLDTATDEAATWYVGSPTGRLMEIDLTTGGITRTLEFEGSYLSAREVGGSIRIVLTAPANRFAFVYPSNDGAVDAAEEANRALIESSTIEQWLPTYRISEGGTTVTEGSIVDCERVHLPAEFSGFGSLVMLTADLDDGLEINDALSVFTDGQTVYASTDRLAVATQKWPTFSPTGEILPDEDAYATAIHSFDITDPNQAGYAASGSVRGHLLNQYSLSEYDGYLRVATTDGSPWWGRDDETSESFVTVLAEDGNVLNQVGQVGGLGVDEQIFAVRFIGDQGYVVTFRQIDPLYTIDLSDPTDPQVAGELKIPGFSSYLHPIDDGHLLGVGTDGDEEGRTFGTAVSLFDVTDPANPSLLTKLNFDETADAELGSGSNTPVAGDAKAFTYWEGTAIVPISWWSYGRQAGGETNGSAAVLVDVDVDGSLVERGRISHPSTRHCEGGGIVPDVPPPDVPTDAEADFVEPQPPIDTDEYCFVEAPQINRSMIIDGDLYTISNAGVQVNDFATLDDVTWIGF